MRRRRKKFNTNLRPAGPLTKGLHELCQYVESTYGKAAMGTLVEIGSYTGDAAKIFLQYFEKVICVDPWREMPEYMAIIPEDSIPWRRIEALFNERAPKAVKMKMTGDEASEKIGFVDGVYIDAVHTYPAVKNDIKMWLPHCRAFIAGHDYGAQYPGVQEAVDEVLGDPIVRFQDTSWFYRVENDYPLEKRMLLKPTYHDLLLYARLMGSLGADCWDGWYNGPAKLQQDVAEIATLAHYLNELNMPKESYLEIGIADGGTMRYLTDNVPNLSHTAQYIDECEKRFAAGRRYNVSHLSGLNANSHSKQARQWLRDQPHNYDVIFIDAEHSRAGAMADTQLVLEKANPGAVVVYHDTTNCFDKARWGQLPAAWQDYYQFIHEMRNGHLNFPLAYQGTISKSLGLDIYRHTGTGARVAPAPKPPVTATLLYHLAPVDSKMLDFNLMLLRRYSQDFTNIVVSFAQGPGLLTREQLGDRLPQDERFEYIEVENEPAGETNHFFDRLLPRAFELDNMLTCYAHSKGVGHSHADEIYVALVPWVGLCYMYGPGALPLHAYNLLERNAMFSGPFWRFRSIGGESVFIDADATATYDREDVEYRELPGAHVGTYFCFETRRFRELPGILNPPYRGRWTVEGFPGHTLLDYGGFACDTCEVSLDGWAPSLVQRTATWEEPCEPLPLQRLEHISEPT